MKLLKKSLAILLCIMMIGAISPFYAFAADEAVTSIVLQAETLPAVGVGMFTPSSFSVNEEEYKAGYVESIEAYWYSSDAYSEDRNDYTHCSDTAFAEGKAYCLYLVLYTEVGYPIEEGATVTLTTPYGDVNGVIETFFDDENIGVSFFFDVLELKETEDYFGIIIDEPTLGGTPDTTPEMSSWINDCTVSFISWRINDGTDATPTVFEEDKEYILRVKFTPKPGYYFPEERRVVFNGYDADFVSRDEATGALIYEHLYYIVDSSKVYNIDITGGVATLNDNPVNTANPGKIIWIESDAAPEGKVFDHWEHTGLRNFEDWASVLNVAPFAMPSHNVKIWAAYADEGVYIGNTQLEDGTYLANGATAVQATKPDSGYAYLKNDVLTLENFEYSGDGYVKGSSRFSVYSNYPIDVVLKGNNKITVKDDESTYDEGIRIEGDSTFTAGASDSLTISGGDNGFSADILEMSGGNYDLEGKEDAIYCWELTAENINFNLEADYYEAFYIDGDAEFNDCSITINSNDDGIYAYENIIISNCDVDITAGDDGISIEEGDLEIKDSRITVEADDDAIVSSEESITISNSTLKFETKGYCVSAYADIIFTDCYVDFVAENIAICNEDTDVKFDGGEYSIVSDIAAVYAYNDIVISDCAMLAVSENTDDDDIYFAFKSDSGNIDIDSTLKVVSSENADGSNAVDGFFAEADYVKIGEPVISYAITAENSTASVYEAMPGEMITLTANSAPEGKVFDKWVVTGATVTDATKATTTFKMPAANVTAKATYKNKTVTPPDEPALRPVTVVNGTTSADYSAEGTTVYLTANQIDGKVFSHWVVEGATVEDDKAAETTFVMGSTAVNAEAVYTDCECKCHKSGIAGFFYRILLFFQKLFGKNLVCEACGAKH